MSSSSHSVQPRAALQTACCFNEVSWVGLCSPSPAAVSTFWPPHCCPLSIPIPADFSSSHAHPFRLNGASWFAKEAHVYYLFRFLPAVLGGGSFSLHLHCLDGKTEAQGIKKRTCQFLPNFCLLLLRRCEMWF